MQRNAVPRFQRRATVIMAGVLVAAATLIFAGQTWIDVTPAGQIVQTPHILVSGGDVSSLVSALTVVALAASAALSIAGKWAARLIGVLIGGVGVINVVTIITTMNDLATAASTAVADATGLKEVRGEYVATAAPTITLLLSGLLIVVGVWVIIAHRHWKQSRKYDSAAQKSASQSTGDTEQGSHLDEIDAWDALSASEDPTIR